MYTLMHPQLCPHPRPPTLAPDRGSMLWWWSPGGHGPGEAGHCSDPGHCSHCLLQLLLSTHVCCRCLPAASWWWWSSVLPRAWWWPPGAATRRHRSADIDILTWISSPGYLHLDICTWISAPCISCAGEWLRPPGAGGWAGGDQWAHRAGGRGQVRQPRQAEAARVNILYSSYFI